jgi:hypothetical protein
MTGMLCRCGVTKCVNIGERHDDPAETFRVHLLCIFLIVVSILFEFHSMDN